MIVARLSLIHQGWGEFLQNGFRENFSNACSNEGFRKSSEKQGGTGSRKRHQMRRICLTKCLQKLSVCVCFFFCEVRMAEKSLQIMQPHNSTTPRSNQNCQKGDLANYSSCVSGSEDALEEQINLSICDLAPLFPPPTSGYLGTCYDVGYMFHLLLGQIHVHVSCNHCNHA